MPITFQQSVDKVAQLVKRFTTNRDTYLSPAYREASACVDLISPLFIALGWDVNNDAGAVPAYQNVLVQQGQIDTEGRSKTPDYTFRLNKTLFYVEAKKPGVALKQNADAAYQLRWYGWNTKLPVSILTDFEEFAVYQCRAKPRPGDKASIARLNYYTYDQYADQWRDIWDIFSYEAVGGGAFDHYIDSEKALRSGTPVDADFLEAIEGWRKALAQNLERLNNLSEDDLTDAVQRTLDRLVFLRIAEDRDIEPYGQLQEIGQSDNIYKQLIALFRKADARYNSGLFDFGADGRTTRLAVDDKVLRDIIRDLYGAYNFRLMPVEILGNVYEQFLGKVIRVTSGGHAKVEEKPEVRKAGGVYYTPSYIVDYIVAQTVGKLVEGKTPKEVAKLRVLDMACGSGSFLLGAYQFLLDWHRDWYAANEPAKRKQDVYYAARQSGTGDWRLTTQEKKRILLNNIYGVDIDRQAVEVTKLSLLLKVLEDAPLEQLDMLKAGHERALPNLYANIQCGNSLIGPDYFAGRMELDLEERKRVNAFDWHSAFPAIMKAGGFDCIIGNPPYVRIQTMKEWAPLEVEIYKELYRAAGAGNYDIYVVFVEKGLSLLNKTGRLGYILPHKFFNAKYGEPLRGLIAEGQHLSDVVHFSDQQVFAGATTYTCLMFLNKESNKEAHIVKVTDLHAWRSSSTGNIGTMSAANISSAEWNFAVGEGAQLFGRLGQMPVKLGDISDKLFQGLVTSADSVYLLEPIDDEKNGLVKVRSAATEKEYWLESAVVHTLCKGSRDIRRYHAEPSKRVLFPYDAALSASTGKTVLIDSAEFSRKYPRAWAYLNENFNTLRDREKGKMRHGGWYGYVYPKSVSLFAKRKILNPSIAAHTSFTLDSLGEMFFVGSGGGGGGGYGIILRADIELTYEYVLGLLNSRLLDYYLKQIASTFSGGYYAYNRQYIEQLPIRTINFSDPADKSAHDRIVSHVESMLALHRQLATARSDAERSVIQRQIASTDREIDKLV